MNIHGIDELRRLVHWFDYQNETFNQSFTAEELIKLYRHLVKNEDLPEFCDQWTDEQIEAALKTEPNDD